MKRILAFILFSIFIMVSCQTTKRFSYTVIRCNYFDEGNYSMNKTDTNAVSNSLYQSIFNTIHFDTMSKALLMKIYSTNVVWEEYGLYDYKTKKYFYCSSKGSKLYSFKEVVTKESKLMYNRMNEFIYKPETLSNHIQGRKQLLDGDNFELSLINVNTQNEVIVKSYYW